MSDCSWITRKSGVEKVLRKNNGLLAAGEYEDTTRKKH
jgi:hypothetical protein